MQRTTKLQEYPVHFLHKLFSRMREQSPAQGLCSLSMVLLSAVRGKNAVYLGLTYGLCPWNLIQNLIYLNYFGDKKQGEESLDDYRNLVMILHSSTGLVYWLSRTTATRIWVANTKTRRPGEARGVEEFHPLSGTAEDYRGQGSHHSQS